MIVKNVKNKLKFSIDTEIFKFKNLSFTYVFHQANCNLTSKFFSMECGGGGGNETPPLSPGLM